MKHGSAFIRRARVTRWSWIIDLVALGSFLLSGVFFVVVGGMIWRGDVWAFIIYAEDPYAHLAGGLACLGVAYYLWRGYRNDTMAWKRLAAKWVLLLFSLALAALAGEIGIRGILIKQQQSGSLENLRDERAMERLLQSDNPHPMAAIIDVSDNLDLVFELRPHLDMKFGHRILRTNKHGMRSDVDHSLEKPADTVRVIGLGDSGMFGWGVDQGEEYMAVLERLLNERGDGWRYEVLNLAVPGYNTQLEVESLVHKGLQFSPDVVILGWCENDYQLPFFMLEAEDFTRRDISFLHVYLFQRKKMADLVAGRRVTSMRGFNEEGVDENLRSGAGPEGVRQALLRLKELSAQHSFRVLVSGPLDQQIIQALREVGLPYFNTFEKINASDYPPEYEVHFMHPRPGGHRVIAEHLKNHLAATGYLP